MRGNGAYFGKVRGRLLWVLGYISWTWGHRRCGAAIADAWCWQHGFLVLVILKGLALIRWRVGSRHVCLHLLCRVLDYHKKQRVKSYDRQEVLARLPFELRSKILRHLYLPTIAQVGPA